MSPRVFGGRISTLQRIFASPARGSPMDYFMRDKTSLHTVGHKTQALPFDSHAASRYDLRVKRPVRLHSCSKHVQCCCCQRASCFVQCQDLPFPRGTEPAIRPTACLLRTETAELRWQITPSQCEHRYIFSEKEKPFIELGNPSAWGSALDCALHTPQYRRVIQSETPTGRLSRKGKNSDRIRPEEYY
ncbi:hypothetical protein BO82DRAFT_47479 [Aspergillus uvarum CBS 121591]|uniref:Uncharacterized protein n=1 Tax=Aspergillus uvarum CBS 121591 TaxID=1448315 RepID=A0A319CJ60_9EURO|nr:hypothetical protein BO82DRAFT_47479 [Aspergillus uvarum CBS 121591]PYH83197.1 hypothetical protein BO82DRAFT_47479 [Aspergillus uvarum CBS 121591]